MNNEHRNVTEEAENLIAEAISRAEDIRDPLEGLVEKTATDPGAAFMPEVLERVAALKKEDRPAFEALRSKLKKAGKTKKQEPGPPPPPQTAAAMEAELERLRRELEEVKKERDFLKKAAAFFANQNK